MKFYIIDESITLEKMLTHESPEVRRHAKGCMAALQRNAQKYADALQIVRDEFKNLEDCKGFKCERKNCNEPAAYWTILDGEKRYICVVHSFNK